MDTRCFYCRVSIYSFLLVWLVFLVRYVAELLAPRSAFLYGASYIYVGFLVAGVAFFGMKTACVRVTQKTIRATVLGIPIIVLALDEIKKVMPCRSKKRTLNIFTMGNDQITVVYGHGKMQNFSLIDNEDFLNMMSHCYTHDGFNDGWTRYGKPAHSMRVIRAFLVFIYLAINGMLSFGKFSLTMDLWMYSLNGLIAVSFANVVLVAAYIKSYGEKIVRCS